MNDFLKPVHFASLDHCRGLALKRKGWPVVGKMSWQRPLDGCDATRNIEERRLKGRRSGMAGASSKLRKAKAKTRMEAGGTRPTQALGPAPEKDGTVIHHRCLVVYASLPFLWPRTIRFADLPTYAKWADGRVIPIGPRIGGNVAFRSD